MNTSVLSKSKSLNKISSLVNKEEIFKEFYEYKKGKMKIKNFSDKVNRSTSGMNRPISAISLSKFKCNKVTSIDSGRRSNASNSEFNRSKDRTMNSLGIESVKSINIL